MKYFVIASLFVVVSVVAVNNRFDKRKTTTTTTVNANGNGRSGDLFRVQLQLPGGVNGRRRMRGIRGNRVMAYSRQLWRKQRRDLRKELANRRRRWRLAQRRDDVDSDGGGDDKKQVVAALASRNIVENDGRPQFVPTRAFSLPRFG